MEQFGERRDAIYALREKLEAINWKMMKSAVFNQKWMETAGWHQHQAMQSESTDIEGEVSIGFKEPVALNSFFLWMMAEGRLKAMRAISFEVNSEVVKKCGELWRDEVDEETKAKYKTLYKDRLERISRFDTKVARPSAMDVDKSEDMNARFEEDVDEKASGELSAGIGQTGGGAVSNLIEGVNPLLSLIYKMVINVLEDLEDDLLKVNHNDSQGAQAVEKFSFWAKFILKSRLMMDDLMEVGATNLVATEAGQLASSILTSILANYDLLDAEVMSQKKEKLPEGLQSPAKEGLVPGNVFQGITAVVKEEEGESNQNQQSGSRDQDEGGQENLDEILVFQGITAVVKEEERESNQNQQSGSKDQDEGDQENLNEIPLVTVVGQEAGSILEKCDLL